MDLGLLRAAIDEAAAEVPPELAEAVLALVRPAVELAVAEYDEAEYDEAEAGEGGDEAGEGGDEDDAGVLAGEYGGLPVGDEWPVFEGEPLVLVARLDCAVLAGLLGPVWTLPADGSLLCFNDHRHRDGDGACRVLHVPDGAPTMEAPDGATVIPALPLGAWPCLSVPELMAAELDEWRSRDLPGVADVLAALRPVVPYTPHQVLGRLDDAYYPRLTGVVPLLQLEGERGTSWGECVRIAFVLPEEDLAAGRLDRVRVVYETA